MSNTAPNATTRPFGVVIVAVLILLAAFFNIWMGVLLLVAPLGSNPTFTDLAGNAQDPIPTFYLVVNGILSIVMAFIYFWLFRMTLVGSATAHLIISMFAVINIIFAFFRLPFGWGMILVNILVLLLVNTAKAKAWFSQNA